MNDQDYRMILRRMIDTELGAMTFYQHASELLEDAGARFHFELLADEELEHARGFYALYPDTDIPAFETLVAQARAQCLPEVQQQMAGLNEQQALQVAVEMEHRVEAGLRRLYEDEVHCEQARRVIRRNVESTASHALLIEEDLERLCSRSSGEEPR